jgi:hypothetical protein
MQPIRQLANTLEALATEGEGLFTLSDLRGALPDLGSAAFRVLISRAEKQGLLQRICRGLYRYPRAQGLEPGLLLYRAAARLRADEFIYISLESALSDAGVISQIPLHWVTLMSSGRSHIIDCGRLGHIEFVHTRRRPERLADELIYDARCGLWRASVGLAIRDMRLTRRNTDLIDWKALDEPV